MFRKPVKEVHLLEFSSCYIDFKSSARCVVDDVFYYHFKRPVKGMHLFHFSFISMMSYLTCTSCVNTCMVEYSGFIINLVHGVFSVFLGCSISCLYVTFREHGVMSAEPVCKEWQAEVGVAGVRESIESVFARDGVKSICNHP